MINQSASQCKIISIFEFISLFHLHISTIRAKPFTERGDGVADWCGCVGHNIDAACAHDMVVLQVG